MLLLLQTFDSDQCDHGDQAAALMSLCSVHTQTHCQLSPVCRTPGKQTQNWLQVCKAQGMRKTPLSERDLCIQIIIALQVGNEENATFSI